MHNAYIDLSALFLNAREAGVVIDYRKLLSFLDADNVFGFTVFAEENQTQKRFLEVLEEFGIDITKVNVKLLPDKVRETNPICTCELIYELREFDKDVEKVTIISPDFRAFNVFKNLIEDYDVDVEVIFPFSGMDSEWFEAELPDRMKIRNLPLNQVRNSKKTREAYGKTA